MAEEPQYLDIKCNNGKCVLQMTQMSQTQRIQDTPKSHTALRVTEGGSMTEHGLNSSANFLHIKCFKHLS